jgi:TetR/AcrR family transcriptional repressor of nem operon
MERLRGTRGREPGRRTADEVLDAAERLVQTRGFNGFSYADIAAELGITKASLHYHFPTKAELVRELVARYTAAFEAKLAEIGASEETAVGRLERYAGIFADAATKGRMCLCGMLAAEQVALPEPVRAELRGFFDVNEQWLAGVLEEGKLSGELGFPSDSAGQARFLISALEGILLVSHALGEPSRLQESTSLLLRALVKRG